MYIFKNSAIFQFLYGEASMGRFEFKTYERHLYGCFLNVMQIENKSKVSQLCYINCTKPYPETMSHKTDNTRNVAKFDTR